jgi:translation initiation factor IF-2
MKPSRQLYRTPPGKENKGHGKAGSTPKADIAATLSPRILDLEETQQQHQQEQLVQLESQQRQLSQQGLTADLKGTVEALDIELGRVRVENVQLEAKVNTVTTTLNTLGDAVF